MTDGGSALSLATPPCAGNRPRNAQRVELLDPPALRAPPGLRAAPDVFEPLVDDFADPLAALARVPADLEAPVVAFEPAADLLPLAADLLPPEVFAADALAPVREDAVEEPPALRVRPPRFDRPWSPASGLTLLTASPTLSTAFDTVLRMFSGTLITLSLSLVGPISPRTARRPVVCRRTQHESVQRTPYAEAVTPGPAASRRSTAWSTPPLR